MSEPRFGRPAEVWALLAAVYGLAILIGGSVSTPVGGPEYDDKLAHLIAFGGQYLLVARAAAAAGVDRGSQVLTGLGVAGALGAGLELWQALLPHRAAEMADFVADVAGALAAATGEEILRRLRRAA